MDLATLQARPAVALLGTVCAICITYGVGLAINRLWLSPIAKFPGPKLAALTKWYEFYYEVVQSGQFTFHIQDLHKQYGIVPRELTQNADTNAAQTRIGPIIRITPEELHIQDSEFFEQFYVKSGRMDKYQWMAGRFGTEDAFMMTSPDDLHRVRRAALNPYFSKKRIMEFQPVIRKKIDKLCQKIAEFHEKDSEFHWHKAMTAYAGDVISEYSFAKSYDHLDSPEFSETWYEPMHAACESGALTLQFPWLWRLMNSLPDAVVLKLQPLLYMLIRLQQDFKMQIAQIISGENEGYKHAEHPTIFHEMLHSDLAPEEKTFERLFQEAQIIIGGGILTTSWALTVTGFHIVGKPQIFRKLRAELLQAIPDRMAPLDVVKLEKLPYLNACIREGVRLAYGTTSRMPRLAHKAVQYRDWTIPARTPTSMTIVDINHDEEVFPDSYKFIPDRWLDNPKTKRGDSLERYFVGFSRGTRSCIGINLAYAELYMGLAAIFRQFTLELYDTDVSDTIMVYDHFIPTVKLDSKGVRFKVKSIDP